MSASASREQPTAFESSMPRRFHPPAIWLGILTAIVAAAVTIAFITATEGGSILMVLPVYVLALGSAVFPGSARRRGVGLGFVVAGGVMLLLGALLLFAAIVLSLPVS